MLALLMGCLGLWGPWDRVNLMLDSIEAMHCATIGALWAVALTRCRVKEKGSQAAQAQPQLVGPCDDDDRES